MSWPMPKPPPYPADDEGRIEPPNKWDVIAEAFARGELVPANSWEAWHDQAIREATLIRELLPSVGVLVEVGCGVGRLTPYLAKLFPRVVATDTSRSCRRVTRERARHYPNVKVLPPDNPYVKGDAALVWGNLYDSDWPAAAVQEHRRELQARYPVVLEGTPERWMLVEDTPTGKHCRTFEQ